MRSTFVILLILASSLITASLTSTPNHNHLESNDVYAAQHLVESAGRGNLHTKKRLTLHDIGLANNVKDIDEYEFLRFHSNISCIDIKGHELIVAKKSDYYYLPGLPYVPIEDMHVNLGKSKKVVNIFVLDGDIRTTKVNNVLRAPEAIPLLPRPINGTRATYGKRFFPDNPIIHWEQRGSKLYLRVARIIYDLAYEKAIVLDSIKIGIKYADSDPAIGESFIVPLEVQNSSYIIIAPSEFVENLTSLAELHRDLNPVIVNLSWIYRNFDEAEPPSLPGYTNSSLPLWDTISNFYNFSLALRIIEFLRNISDRPRYVVLVGDADILPPSYYYWDEKFYEEYSYYEEDAWVPTDFFYMSPDYDFDVDLYVARIPARSPEQISSYLEKLQYWHTALNSGAEWIKRAYAFAGVPFGTPLFVGEGLILNMLADGLFGNLSVRKFFESDGNYSLDTLYSVLHEDIPGFLIVLAHGEFDKLSKSKWGTAFYWEDLLDTYQAKYFNANRSPIFITFACQSAGYDYGEISNEDDLSFSEVALFSSSIAAAYVGNTRISFGSYSAYLDDGKLKFLTQPYAQGIIYNLFKVYVNGSRRLGEVFGKALEEYYKLFGVDYWINLRTILESVLLGDPALLLPKITRGKISPPTIEGLDVRNFKEIYNANGQAPLGSDDSLLYVSINGSSEVVVKLVSVSIITLRGTPEFYYSVKPPAVIAFKPSYGGLHILKVIGPNGVESRFYVYIEPIELIGMDVAFIDFDGNGKYDAVNISLVVDIDSDWMSRDEFLPYATGFDVRFLIMPNPNLTFNYAYLDRTLSVANKSLGRTRVSRIFSARPLTKINQTTPLYARLRIYPWWPRHGGWFTGGDYIDVAVDYAIKLGDSFDGDDFEPLLNILDAKVEFVDGNNNSKYDAIIAKIWVDSKSKIALKGKMCMAMRSNTCEIYSYGRSVQILEGTNYFETYFDADFIYNINGTADMKVGLYIDGYFVLKYVGSYNTSDFEYLSGVPDNFNITLTYEYLDSPSGVLVYADVESSNCFQADFKVEVSALYDNGSLAETIISARKTEVLPIGMSSLKLVFIYSGLTNYSKVLVRVRVYHHQTDTFISEANITLSLPENKTIIKATVNIRQVDVNMNGKTDHILVDIDANMTFPGLISCHQWGYVSYISGGWGLYISSLGPDQQLIVNESKHLFPILASIYRDLSTDFGNPSFDYCVFGVNITLNISMGALIASKIMVCKHTFLTLSKDNYTVFFSKYEVGWGLPSLPKIELSPTIVVVIEGTYNLTIDENETISIIGLTNRFTNITPMTEIYYLLLEIDDNTAAIVRSDGKFSLEAGKNVTFRAGQHRVKLDVLSVAYYSFDIRIEAIERIPPRIISISYPTEADAFATIYIYANVRDNYAVSSVRIVYTLETRQYETPMHQTGATNCWVGEIPPQEKNGTLYFYIVAIDEFGNKAQSDTYSIRLVYLDEEPPRIIMVAWKPEKPDVGDIVTIEALIRDNTKIARVYIEILDSKEKQVNMQYYSPDGIWIRRIKMNGTKLKFIVHAVDIAGNKASSSTYTIEASGHLYAEWIQIAIIAFPVAIAASIVVLILKRRRNPYEKSIYDQNSVSYYTAWKHV